MENLVVDLVIFAVFIVAVVFVGLMKSRTEHAGGKNAQDFFLAGRGLSWWLIGFSLIAANISTEQFVGMSGNAASHAGLAIASYEWMAAVTLVVVAFAFLPYFLRAGIYTMPEFLEYRYNRAARLIMATATIIMYLVLLASVTYSGALTVRSLGRDSGISIDLWQPSLFLMVIAAIYVVCGGLKASVWADLLQGTALILGGAVIMYIAFQKLGTVPEAAMLANVETGEIAIKAMDPEKGAIERFTELNANRLNMFLPKDDHLIPWTALLLGAWIPNFYYWGLNQYITQRTLGSSSLADGQKGIVFAAYLKLVIPFVVVIPGIVAFNLFHEDMQLEARGNAATAMARYLKVNPATKFVITAANPDSAIRQAHSGPVYMLAIYEDPKQLAKAEGSNKYVLPILRSSYDELEADGLWSFSSKEDHAWEHINPELHEEVENYNQQVAKQAKESGESVKSQALVAYKYDTALGKLLGMLPRNKGIFGFVMAALLGAVISSLAAMLNAASSIFTMDLYSKCISPHASQHALVTLGRIAVLMFAAVACAIAPSLDNPNISNSIFTIIQASQGLISPGVLAVFVVGIVLRRCPRSAGVVGLITSIVCYSGLSLMAPDLQFLNRMASVFGICLAVMITMTLVMPLKEPVQFESRTNLNLESSKGAFVAGLIGIVLALILYVIFSPLVVAR